MPGSVCLLEGNYRFKESIKSKEGNGKGQRETEPVWGRGMTGHLPSGDLKMAENDISKKKHPRTKVYPWRNGKVLYCESSDQGSAPAVII